MIFPPFFDDLLLDFSIVVLVHAFLEIEEGVEMFIDFFPVGLPLKIQIFTGSLKEGRKVLIVVVEQYFFRIRYQRRGFLLFWAFCVLRSFIWLFHIRGVGLVDTVNSSKLCLRHVFLLQ